MQILGTVQAKLREQPFAMPCILEFNPMKLSFDILPYLRMLAPDP